MSSALSANKPGTKTQAAGSKQKGSKAPQAASAASAASAARAGQTASARSAFEYAGAPRRAIRASCDHAKVVDLLASAIGELNAEVPAEQGRTNGNANAALQRAAANAP